MNISLQHADENNKKYIQKSTARYVKLVHTIQKLAP